MANKQQKRELVSTFIDRELNSDELDQLLKMMQDDDSVTDDLLRYQTASDALQGYQYSSQSKALYQRISTELENEQPHSQSHTDTAQILMFPRRFWKQTMGGLAVAASVAVLVSTVEVNDASPTSSLTTTPLLADADNATQPEKAANLIVLPAADRWTVSEGDVDNQLDKPTTDKAPYYGQTGLFPYGKVVSYDQQ